VLANMGEGFYEVGDVAVSPHRRDVRAVDRDGTRVEVFRAPDGPVEDVAANLGAPGANMILSGTVPDGLKLILDALRTRFGAPSPGTLR
jgi:hypothetical protein